MSSEEATLIAALIAAISSIIILLFNIWNQLSSESRVAQRSTLEQYLSDLGESIHETVATSSILIKTKTEKSAAAWKNRSKSAKDKLQELIPKLRYPLWGITDNMRTFSRLPDWVEHARKYPDHANDILENGKKLSEALEIAIKNSYVLGRTPTRFEILRIKFYTWKFERTYQKFKNGNLP